MKAGNTEFPGKYNSDTYDEDDTQKLSALQRRGIAGTLEKNSLAMNSAKTSSEDGTTIEEVSLAMLDELNETDEVSDNQIEMPVDEFAPSPEITGAKDESSITEEGAENTSDREVTSSLPNDISDENNATANTMNAAAKEVTSAKTTLELPALSVAGADTPRFVHPPLQKRPVISRGRAILLVALLVIVALNAVNLGSTQFLGSQGWAYVLGGPATKGNHNPLDTVKNILLSPTPGVKEKQKLTPTQYINLLIQNMSLDQKLGQMMIVQFYGPSYSLDISTMISQYNVGAVLLYSTNDNISSKSQLKDLIQQMQSNSAIPLAVAIDQEGGTVDRLIKLDGPRPSATSIGATGNPLNAYNEGVRDANDLSSYGFNLNLAPVVDVNNVYNPQMYLRTFGNNPTTVTQMAEAYLQGLQKSGKVLGTLKHFPGLGDVVADPHNSVPHLNRSESDLMKIDWAPYRAMIQQDNVYSIMVTHEIVEAVDSAIPSSLSYKLVTGILRNQLGFQGVIMTDSLTMEGILAYYTEAQAAVLAVEAGDDLLMGPSTSGEVAAMVTGLKQAISSGQISQQRIDDSVRRILTMKYAMGLLHIPAN